MFKVIEPGLFSTIQDIGRFHYRKFGVGAGGPMDIFSFRIGNILVGNKNDESSLEVTVFGPKLMALEDTAIAITGGDLGFTINDKYAPMWEAIKLDKGDLLGFKGLRKGCRAYISIFGGIDVPKVMGSQSYSSRYRIGGIGGRPLIKGDVIKSRVSGIGIEKFIGRKISKEICSKIEEIYSWHEKEATVLRVIVGPFEDHFSTHAIKKFLNSEYIITRNADRMGYRLEGPQIKHNFKGPDIISIGLVPGAIQVPGNHKPIIFLHEGAFGGYPLIATIISTDLCKIGQLKPGDKIKFNEVNIRQARSIKEEYENEIKSFIQCFL